MKNEIVAFYSPKAQESEVFRTLRTNIQFMSNQKELRTLLITSTMSGEGKSWVAANLAVTFAQTGIKVILVDTDMRKGRQASLFEKASEPGLSNYLSGIYSTGKKSESDVHSYIHSTEMGNLYLMTAGSVPPNPSELLVSEKMSELIECLKEEHDLIIFDGTPSSIVTDSVILSTKTDATLIVAAYKKTKTEDLKRLKKEIDNVGGKVIGVTLNRIKEVSKRYEKGYYYYTDITPTTVKHG